MEFFDIHDSAFPARVTIVSVAGLIIVGLIVNKCKTDRKRKREFQSRTINPILDTV